MQIPSVLLVYLFHRQPLVIRNFREYWNKLVKEQGFPTGHQHNLQQIQTNQLATDHRTIARTNPELNQTHNVQQHHSLVGMTTLQLPPQFNG